ncbi:isochorismatase family cysteine hydrolase [Sphingomonas sp.]|jgi:nicotinamidase-related amidase|uniref:cysteine hydrolase family protein n=1 Tax=Sphingomonas sp. TaxID=28214 RepID=UPI002EDA4FB3
MARATIDTPAAGGTALLIIDMINDMRFEGADELRRPAEAAAHAILGLRDAADEAGVPVVYVNDNFGEWHSERSRLVDRCLDGGDANHFLRALQPRDDDYFVIKPQFSGFYATNLPVLLPKLRVSRLILTGVAADICVLFTAADAHMRDYGLWVPSDAVAGEHAQRTSWALEIMKNSMAAQICSTDDMSLRDWVGQIGA